MGTSTTQIFFLFNSRRPTNRGGRSAVCGGAPTNKSCLPLLSGSTQHWKRGERGRQERGVEWKGRLAGAAAEALLPPVEVATPLLSGNMGDRRDRRREVFFFAARGEMGRAGSKKELPNGGGVGEREKVG